MKQKEYDLNVTEPECCSLIRSGTYSQSFNQSLINSICTTVTSSTIPPALT